MDEIRYHVGDQLYVFRYASAADILTQVWRMVRDPDHPFGLADLAVIERMILRRAMPKVLAGLEAAIKEDDPD